MDNNIICKIVINMLYRTYLKGQNFDIVIVSSVKGMKAVKQIEEEEFAIESSGGDRLVKRKPFLCGGRDCSGRRYKTR